MASTRSFGRQDYESEYEQKDSFDREHFQQQRNHYSPPSQYHQQRQDHSQYSQDYDSQQEQEREQEQQEEEEEYTFTTSPTENEKSTAMVSLFDMRNDAAFCDVAFLVHGCLFRAHKVIVRYGNKPQTPTMNTISNQFIYPPPPPFTCSSWSRWMYALLSEGSEQEIISLDIFTPAEFGSILDYMYGQPLEFTLKVPSFSSTNLPHSSSRMPRRCSK
jgi:hypothetical protein